MVHVRLIHALMMVALILLSILHICSVVRGDEISSNFVHDPVELGNPYLSNGNYRSVQKPAHISRRHRPSVNNPSHPSRVMFSDEDIASIKPVIKSDGGSHSHMDDSEKGCVACAASRQNSKISATLTADALKLLRIELIKTEILKKLGLTEPPKVKNLHSDENVFHAFSGNPVISKVLRGDADDDATAKSDFEDFYGKTEQIIVMPQSVINADCTNPHHRHEAASCFHFNLPKELKSNQISSAELWVYKYTDFSGEDSSHEYITHNFTISEKRPGNPHFSMITARHDVPETAGWINFNLTQKARKWLKLEGHEPTVKISCTTCSKDSNEFPFANDIGEQQPFIVFHIANEKRRRRSRRSINCSPGVTDCCRESFEVSFKDIGWDWIYEPKVYSAYYCKGKCYGNLAQAQSATHHSNVMMDVVKRLGGMNNATVDLVPCCTPVLYKDMSLFYRSNNDTMSVTTLPNMIVEACGCK